MFSVTNTTSPIFLAFLGSALLLIVFAIQGIVRGRLPNMHTSVRGARMAGVLSLVSLLFVGMSFYQFYNSLEFYGTILATIAAALFITGITLAERAIR